MFCFGCHRTSVGPCVFLFGASRWLIVFVSLRNLLLDCARRGKQCLIEAKQHKHNAKRTPEANQVHFVLRLAHLSSLNTRINIRCSKSSHRSCASRLADEDERGEEKLRERVPRGKGLMRERARCLRGAQVVVAAMSMAANK